MKTNLSFKTVFKGETFYVKEWVESVTLLLKRMYIEEKFYEETVKFNFRVKTVPFSQKVLRREGCPDIRDK